MCEVGGEKKKKKHCFSFPPWKAWTQADPYIHTSKFIKESLLMELWSARSHVIEQVMKWNYNTFDWCFNTSEFSPQKPEMKHRTAQSLCKRPGAQKNPIKSRVFFCCFLRFFSGFLCAPLDLPRGVRGFVYSVTLRRHRCLERRDFYRAAANAAVYLGLDDDKLSPGHCVLFVSYDVAQEISTWKRKNSPIAIQTPNVNGDALRLQICQFESGGRHF